MKEEWSAYLTAIDASSVVATRVEELTPVAQSLCPEDIQDIFVSEYREENGDSVAESLWFLSHSYCLEAKHFLRDVDIDITSLSGISYLQTKWRNPWIDHPTPDSRLVIEFHAANGLVPADMRASDANCEYLRDILSRYLKTHLMG